MKLQEFLSHFKEVSGSCDQYKARCPAHDDRTASLSLKRCENGNIVLYCHAGCDYRDVVKAAGLKVQDLYEEDFASKTAKSRWVLVAEYHYKSTLKKKRWRLPDGSKIFSWEHRTNPSVNSWQKSAGGQEIPLYCQDALILLPPDNTVYVVEGEKDADLLTQHGRAAICSPHGATKGNPSGKWLPAYTAMLKGYNAVIIQDNDEVGKIYARTVAASLQGVAKSVKVLDLTCKWSDLPEHGDISDVFEMSGKDPNVFDALDEMASTALMVDMTVELPPYELPAKSEATSAEHTSYTGSDIISARDLQKAVLPPVKYLVDGILAEGTSIISAASKIGKSWLVLYLGLLLAAGERFFDKRTEQCGVLYLALEDTHNRLQDRMNKVLGGKPAPEQFYFVTDVPNLDCGLLNVLEEHLRQYPAIRLIIGKRQIEPPLYRRGSI